MGPPSVPWPLHALKLHNQFGEGVAVRCALQGNDRTLMLQIRVTLAQMGSLTLSLFPCDGAEEIYKSGDCPRGMGTLHVETFPTIRCILSSSA